MTDQPCPLCVQQDVVLRNTLAYARRDNFALNRGHVLVVPVRHVADFFDMTSDEKHAVVALLDEAKAQIDKEHGPDGYNIGKAGGQSRMHVHVHLIPRYLGDVADPRGGFRCVLSRMTQK
jgi:diadenosine tetraphosphate (Ap4A) HIT family hydrolase